MSIDHDSLSAGLHALADRAPAPEAPIDELLRAGHRARRGRRTALGTAGVGVAAVAAAAVAIIAIGHGPAGDTPTNGSGTGGQSTAVASPETRLAAAARVTAETSFRFRLTFSMTSHEPDMTLSGTEQYAGACDPARGRSEFAGVSRGARGIAQRIIENDVYLLDKAGDWQRDPSANPEFLVPGDYLKGVQVAGGLTADPVRQLDALRHVGTVTYGGRQGSVERYSFHYLANGDGIQAPSQYPVDGFVEVGVETGRVSKISYDFDIKYHGIFDERTFVWELFDYGTAVNIEAPTVK